MSPRLICGLLVMFFHLPSFPAALSPDSSRAFAPGQKPPDRRASDLRTLSNSEFMFRPVSSAEEWLERADQLRVQVLVATGLWPMPVRTPLNATITGLVQRNEYTVEKVYFESLPGHYVTGNLYRPKGRTGPLPLVLCPHGHWEHGRFSDRGADGILEEIAGGAERFEYCGRFVVQARCVQLARMGCVVFQYDMEGYADSEQLAHIAHKLEVREPLNTLQDWGLMSPQAELHLQNLMGLQTWNSIRALDYLLTLPEADSTRIAVTGASGGGTQTFMLCAVDGRPDVAFPAVMVSTAMQGGCTCENAPYLRIGAGNIDLAALMAPKPLGMTGAHDWTQEIETKGYPDLKRLYTLLGHPENVMARAFLHFGHNYNSVSRTVMYNWFNRHLQLGYSEPVIESEFIPLSRDELTVWDSGYPEEYLKGVEHECRLLQKMARDTRALLEKALPRRRDGYPAFQRMLSRAFDVMFGRRLDQVGNVCCRRVRGDPEMETGVVVHSPEGAQIPVLRFKADGQARGTLLWIHQLGKRGLLTSEREPLAQALAAGYDVVGADLFLQGEHLDGTGPLTSTTGLFRVETESDPWTQFSGYVFGYNYTLFSRRVHDILTLVRYFKDEKKEVRLIGLDSTAAPLVAAARCQAGPAVARAAVATQGFRFAGINRYDHPAFVPGAAKYFDICGLLLEAAPAPLWLADPDQLLIERVSEVYRMLGQRKNLQVLTEKGPDTAANALQWLVQ